MLHYALSFFLAIALIAGVLGFGFPAATAASIAKICFLSSLWLLFLISFFSGRRGPVA